MSNERASDILKLTIMEKEFGNYMMVSGGVEEIYSTCVRELAGQIIKTLPKAGMRYLPDSAKIFWKKIADQYTADPLGGVETIGAKVRAEIDTDPKTLFCMLVHLVTEAREHKDRESNRANRLLAERGKLWQMIANATSLKELKNKLREMEDKDDYD